MCGSIVSRQSALDVGFADLVVGRRPHDRLLLPVAVAEAPSRERFEPHARIVACGTSPEALCHKAIPQIHPVIAPLDFPTRAGQESDGFAPLRPYEDTSLVWSDQLVQGPPRSRMGWKRFGCRSAPNRLFGKRELDSSAAYLLECQGRWGAHRVIPTASGEQELLSWRESTQRCAHITVTVGPRVGVDA